MDGNTACWLMVNPSSGSNDDSSTEMVIAALTSRGWTVDRVIAFPEDSLPTGAALDAAGVSMLVIYTGDGSMNAAISRLEGWSGQVLVLPGGTMNLLPLRLHRSINIGTILDVVAGGGARPLRPRCVRCDAGIALAGLLVGPGTAWSRVRESMRNFDLADMAKDTIDAIRATNDDPCVLFPGNRLARDEGYPLVELTPGEFGMQIDGYFAEDAADYAGQAWALLRRRFREGPHDRLGIADSIVLTTADGGALLCLIDGEPAECPSGSRFVVVPCGVDVLATAHDA